MYNYQREQGRPTRGGWTIVAGLAMIVGAMGWAFGALTVVTSGHAAAMWGAFVLGLFGFVAVVAQLLADRKRGDW